MYFDIAGFFMHFVVYLKSLLSPTYGLLLLPIIYRIIFLSYAVINTSLIYNSTNIPYKYFMLQVFPFTLKSFTQCRKYNCWILLYSFYVFTHTNNKRKGKIKRFIVIANLMDATNNNKAQYMYCNNK